MVLEAGVVGPWAAATLVVDGVVVRRRRVQLDHQHGFRKHHSTVSALAELSDYVTTGLNKKKPVERTVMVCLDLSKAFDTVNHEQLLQDIFNLDVNDRIKKFLKAYLSGRQSYTVFQDIKSKSRTIRQGVPQGGVLSPLLFNIYLSSLPLPPESSNIEIFSYADDCSIVNRGTDIKTACEELNPYLDKVATWFSDRCLQISAPKSSATVFSTWSNDCSTILPISIQGKPVPTEKNPKVLGVIFDPLFTFNKHVETLKTKVAKRNNVLKALAGSTWGKSKEVLLNTYKAIGKSVLSYGTQVWSPLISATNWTSLQTQQNHAIRTITGSTKMSKIEHLHSEAKLLQVKDHCDLLTKQYVATMHHSEHPNHHIAQEHHIPPRVMRQTPMLTHKKDLPIINLDPLPSKKILLSTIHTQAVEEAISKLPPNQVLNAPAPEISKDEVKLPRKTRSTLSQLRSSYSPFLQSYMYRINKAESDRCPKCLVNEHTTDHLFNCPANPTTLTARDLWANPIQAAEHLDLPTTELEDNMTGEQVDPG